ncbi:MAG: N-6 DNA methylase [Patescibacteria group bacterium]
MTKEQAKQLVQETLQNSFDKERFVRLARNLLNTLDDSKNFSYHGQFIPDAFKVHVKRYERVGKYEDPEDGKLDVLIVYLQKETTLEQARTGQRNFTAWYLKRRGEKDAALIAFVSPNEEEWRFSFVKMEYRLTESAGGRVGATEEFTPARRYSFLVGRNENSHTAQSRLVPLLLEDDQNPTLQEIEDAFGIEKVTKEFFERYRDLFLQLNEHLDDLVKSDKKIGSDFADKEIDTINFSKKLLGQIVFLYFLQKKGWFGVERSKLWGSGSRRFLRELFEKKHGDYTNFFNDVLEPLFYEALRQDRSHDDDYYSRFDCRIPFLNGGLFDPLNNYDWVNTDLLLPNELFSNDVRTKSGDIGTGILDVLDRYNFTVKEDEPLEKEVAVDPEMLGKVFENLLEVKDRKSKGTYYTPRAIVHYMCQESLAHYLAAELESKVSKEDIETLIRYGETVVEHDSRVVKKGAETKDYSFKLPESVRSNAALVDEKLAAIRICDPAVGSGAFPVGMMNEIVRTRNALSNYVNGGKERSVCEFKRDAIQHSLYGVDIDPGAVEIAKLRLWLSLVVDEQDIKQIKPLPNLDYKIVQGDSLSSVQKDLFNQPLFKELEELKPKFFEETNTRKKQEYKQQIDELINKITKGRKEFDFEVYFSEVFHEKTGFDVVIANPPYVRHEKIKELKPYLQKRYEVYTGTADLYCYFYELGVRILHDTGVITFITSNKFLRANYGKALKKFLQRNALFHTLIDFGDVPVFEATTYPMIFIAEKGKGDARKFWGCKITSDRELQELEETIQESGIVMKQSQLPPDDVWIIENKETYLLKKKIEEMSDNTKTLVEYVDGKIFYGIKTGYNQAFVIDSNKRNQLIKKDPESEKIIKPFLRGRDVGRYAIRDSKLWLIYSHAGIEIDKYPVVKKHLQQFRSVLERRRGGANPKSGKVPYEWYELQVDYYSSGTYLNFEKPKIVYLVFQVQPTFAYDTNSFYPNNAVWTIAKDDNYLLGFLNSKLCWFLISNRCTKIQNGYQLIFKYLESLPIKIPTDRLQKSIEIKVQQVLEAKRQGKSTTKLEKKIDQLVYKLYGLTPEEIKLVEGEHKQK